MTALPEPTDQRWRITSPERGVCVVEYHHPPVNALDANSHAELRQLLRALEGDDETRVVLFASAHPTIFIAGSDIETMKPLPQTKAAVAERIDNAVGTFARLQHLSKPTIGVIEGHALGGGCELALALDFRFMKRGRARIGLPEAALGLIPAAGGTQRLARLVGRARAADLLMLGRRIDADEAATIGLVRAADDARSGALAYAKRLASMPSSSLRAIKTCLNDGYDGDLPRGLQVERYAALDAFTSDEATEGLTAFLEKRPPRFHAAPTGADT